MAAQSSDCDYCSSYIEQDYAPQDMNKSSVIRILQNVLWDNTQTWKQYNELKSNMPYVPSELFMYNDGDMGEGRKRCNTRKHKRKKRRNKTRHQRGGSTRRNVAHIMTLIVYTSLIYYGLPYVGEAIQKLESLLISSGLLPKLCGNLEEVAAIFTPGDNVCRIREAAYSRMIQGISVSLVSLAAGWGYVKGNLWTTAKKDWGALTDKFENMLEIFENNTAEDIVGDKVNVDYDNENEVAGIDSAKSLASIYKQELIDAELDEELDMGLLNSLKDEPDSQDQYWGPEYGEGRRRRMYRRGHTRRLPRRAKGRGKKCRGGTRRR